MFQGLEFFRALWSNLTFFSFGNIFYGNCFPHVYMDKGAIWKASETDLNQLGLTERGDIIQLKDFAVEKSENKKKLAELITNAGKERPVCKKSRKEKAVTLGWLS